jgi:hypothetical protein
MIKIFNNWEVSLPFVYKRVNYRDYFKFIFCYETCRYCNLADYHFWSL